MTPPARPPTRMATNAAARAAGIATVAATFHRSELGELLLPIAQDVRFYAAQLADLTNREVPLGGNGWKLGAHGW